jgi:putative transposase
MIALSNTVSQRLFGEGYPSDLSETEFLYLIRHPIFLLHNPKCCSLLDLINAMLYVNRTGCQWRALPKDFPKWQTVHRWFRKWSEDGTLELLKEWLVRIVRQEAGRAPDPTGAIIDTQTVHTTETGNFKGYDAGKKKKGMKRVLVVDTQGNPLYEAVVPADMHDSAIGIMFLKKLAKKFPSLKKVFADSGFRVSEERLNKENEDRKEAGENPLILLEVIPNIKNSCGFCVVKRRWVVERTLAWLNRSRRLYKDVERKEESAIGMIHLSCISLLVKRAANPEDNGDVAKPDHVAK